MVTTLGDEVQPQKVTTQKRRRHGIGRVHKYRNPHTKGGSSSSSVNTPPPSSSSPYKSTTIPPSSNTAEQEEHITTTSSLSYKKVRNYIEEEHVRNAIHVIYKLSHHVNHHTTKDLDTIVDVIFNNLGCKICKKVIDRVCQQSKATLDQKTPFNPSRKAFSRPEKIKIKEKSEDEHLVTVLMEKTSYNTATHLYNILVSNKRGSDRVGTKAVFNAVNRTKSMKLTTVKVSQASDDWDFWKKAQLIYCIQYLIRLGKEVPENVINLLDVENKINFSYQKLQQESLTIDSIYRIAFWDEVHFQQVVGEIRDNYISFPRDEFGVYDPSEEIDEGEERVSKNRLCFIHIYIQKYNMILTIC